MEKGSSQGRTSLKQRIGLNRETKHADLSDEMWSPTNERERYPSFALGSAIVAVEETATGEHERFGRRKGRQIMVVAEVRLASARSVPCSQDFGGINRSARSDNYSLHFAASKGFSLFFSTGELLQ